MAVNRIAGAYRGEGKTDAKDAAVIADQARMRRDLRELHLDDTLLAEPRMPTAPALRAIAPAPSTGYGYGCSASSRPWSARSTSPTADRSCSSASSRRPPLSSQPGEGNWSAGSQELLTQTLKRNIEPPSRHQHERPATPAHAAFWAAIVDG
ncbi:transposase [Micromonospora sp. NPDC093243]|uniref:IS110 family transposase n=1 Tax=Micromonospora sp. NPDC093243 TaxID=3364290 RepID=UPI00380EAC84